MNRFTMERVVINITFVCTLDCALCAGDIPYYKPQKHFSIERIKDTVERYFAIVGSVKKFTFMEENKCFEDVICQYLGGENNEKNEG